MLEESDRTIRAAMIFPGQGAQYIGMGKDFCDAFPVAREIFKQVDERLSRSFSKEIFEGNSAELALTKNSQLAIYVTSIAILRVIQDNFPMIRPLICGGLSLGEYSALTAAGKLHFTDGFDLVYTRAFSMHEAAIQHPGMMAAVIGLDEFSVANALDSLPVWVANINCQGQVVISGEKDSFPLAIERVKKAGAKHVIPLDVSGAFHTPLMNDAKLALEAKVMATSWIHTEVPVIMNVSGDIAVDIQETKRLLVRQLVEPVRWEISVQNMAKMQPDCFLEIGPGVTLAAMNRKNGITIPTLSIGKVSDLSSLEQFCRQPGEEICKIF